MARGRAVTRALSSCVQRGMAVVRSVVSLWELTKTVLLMLVADLILLRLDIDNKGLRDAGCVGANEVRRWLALRWRFNPSVRRRLYYWIVRTTGTPMTGGVVCAICGDRVNQWRVDAALGGAKLCIGCDHELEGEVGLWRQGLGLGEPGSKGRL